MSVFTDRVHLTATTLEELHHFAETTGIKKCWFSNHPEHPHYDLPKSLIQKAIDNGAKLTSPRECLRTAKHAKELSKQTFDKVTEVLSQEIGQPIYHGHIILEHFGLYGLEHPVNGL